MSMEFQLKYIVTKADHLRMLFWSICTPHMGLNNQQPCHTTHMEIPPMRGLTICSMIY